MKVFYPITLDVKKTNVQTIIEANQGEGADRELCFTLVNGNEKLNLTAENEVSIIGKKPDDTVFDNECAIKEGKVYYYLTAQNLAVVGDVDCQLQIVSDGLTYSAKFTIHVAEAVVPDETIESSNEFSQLVQLIQAAGKGKVYFGTATPGTDPENYPLVKEDDIYLKISSNSVIVYAASSVSTTVTWSEKFEAYTKSKIDQFLAIIYNMLDSKQDATLSVAKGTNIIINDAENYLIREIYIAGKSTQNGTPTIDNPITIENITTEEIEVTDGENTQTAELDFTLRGIPVVSGGNYTDSNNQQWICDTIERYADGTGKYIQRVGSITFNGSENWQNLGTTRVYLSLAIPNSSTNNPTTLCDIFSLAENGTEITNTDNKYFVNNGNLVASPTSNGTRLNATQFKSYLASNNATLLYKLDTPIETSLTASQLAELNLETYYPETIITSNTDILIKYTNDIKALLDKKQNNLNEGANITIKNDVISANIPYISDFINMADMVKRVRDGGKSFVWDTLDGGYITIVFDDGNKDLSTVADIFEEYEIPLCAAIVPKNLSNISDDPSRTIKDVCDDIVSNGGEILSHEKPTLTDPTDYDTLKTILMDSKEKLVSAGFIIRGFMMPGGEDAIDWRDKNLQRFTQLFYDYSDRCGDDAQYYMPRKSTNPLSTAKAYIDDAVANNKWYVFFAHRLSEPTTESHIRELIEYAISQGATFTTYAEMYDTFGKFE